MRFLKLLLVLILLAALVPLGFTGWRLVAETRQQEPVPPEGRLVPTSMGRIYVEEAGPETGMPVLLVHGSVGWAGLWRETAAALAGAGYRAIAFDMPPMGWSDREDGRGYARATQGQRLTALVEALGIRPVVVAHSFGAGAAAEAAMARPQAFSGLVVVSGALGVGRAGTDTMPAPLSQPLLRHMATASTATNPLLGRWLLARFVHRKEAATEAIAALIAEPYVRRGTTSSMADWMPGLFATPDVPSARGDGWAGLRLPLAFLWGAEDTATPLAQGRYLADLTGAPLTVLPGLGHIPQIEDPAAFQAALIATLAGLGPVPPAPLPGAAAGDSADPPGPASGAAGD